MASKRKQDKSLGNTSPVASSQGRAVVPVSIPLDAHRRLVALAKRRGLTTSSFVRTLIFDKLEAEAA